MAVYGFGPPSNKATSLNMITGSMSAIMFCWPCGPSLQIWTCPFSNTNMPAHGSPSEKMIVFGEKRRMCPARTTDNLSASGKFMKWLTLPSLLARFSGVSNFNPFCSDIYSVLTISPLIVSKEGWCNCNILHKTGFYNLTIVKSVIDNCQRHSQLIVIFLTM